MKIERVAASKSLPKKNTLKDRIRQIKIESPMISPKISIDFSNGNPF